jgi:hypothetical protein
MIPVFICLNAVFLGLGMSCLLHLFGIVMAVSLDSTLRYPRFVPFCLLAGVAALLGLVGVFLWNVKISERLAFTKKIWLWQYVGAFVLSIPILGVWEQVFELLREAF